MSGKVITSKETREQFRKAMSLAKKTDICFTWVKREQAFGVLDAEEMAFEMKHWRNLAKEGVLAMIKQNNQEITFNGKKFWTLCVQSYKGGAIDTENGFNVIDVGGSVFGGDDNFRMVSGAIYGFTSEVNRDLAFNYTMKDIKVK